MGRHNKFFVVKINSTKMLLTKVVSNRFYKAIIDVPRPTLDFKKINDVKIKATLKGYKFRLLEEFDPQQLQALDVKTLESMDRKEIF